MGGSQEGDEGDEGDEVALTRALGQAFYTSMEFSVSTKSKLFDVEEDNLRIINNLLVCVDCHESAKLVSRVYGTEITMNGSVLAEISGIIRRGSGRAPSRRAASPLRQATARAAAPLASGNGSASVGRALPPQGHTPCVPPEAHLPSKPLPLPISHSGGSPLLNGKASRSLGLLHLAAAQLLLASSFLPEVLDGGLMTHGLH
ncbi:hypothetical protein ABZP36_008844 [Zizania latifolia]